MLLKQSFVFVFLQMLNLVAGLFITLYVAMNVEPKVYSIIVVYTIVITLFATFSALGYETVLLRNALKWKTQYQRKLNVFMTYAVVTRVFISLILVFPISLYLVYLSRSKYDGEYLFVFFLFLGVGIISSLNNSFGLILRSFNRYIASFSVSVIGALATKCLALFAFINFGFTQYIVVMVIGPIFILIVSVKLVARHFLTFKFKFKYIKNCKRVLKFGYLGYAKYLVGRSDRLIISVILSPDLLASYSLARQVQEIGRSFIEGFFDPLCQKAVEFKGEVKKQMQYVRKLQFIRAIVLVAALMLFCICLIFVNQIVTLARLERYEHLEMFLIFAMATSIVYLVYKIEGNLTSLFEAPLWLLRIDMCSWALSILVLFIIVLSNKPELIYLSRFCAEVALLTCFIYFWRSNKQNYIRYTGL